MNEQPGITLSGPLAYRAQARTILQSKGFEVAKDDNPTGLPDTTLGDKRASVGFITVEGDDLQLVVDVLEGTGWEIRGHWSAAAPASQGGNVPDLADMVSDHIEASVEKVLREKGLI